MILTYFVKFDYRTRLRLKLPWRFDVCQTSSSEVFLLLTARCHCGGTDNVVKVTQRVLPLVSVHWMLFVYNYVLFGCQYAASISLQLAPLALPNFPRELVASALLLNNLSSSHSFWHLLQCQWSSIVMYLRKQGTIKYLQSACPVCEAQYFTEILQLPFGHQTLPPQPHHLCCNGGAWKEGQSTLTG